MGGMHPVRWRSKPVVTTVMWDMRSPATALEDWFLASPPNNAGKCAAASAAKYVFERRFPNLLMPRCTGSEMIEFRR